MARGNPDPLVGRPAWSEHKARVRRALLDAALELFSAHGFEATSTEQVAARAGVSPRTFFRYFATKESVLFFGEDDFTRSFVGVYRAQPPELTELEAMRASFVLLAPVLTRLRERIKLYRRAVASSPVLRGQEQDHHEQNVATVARAIAKRRGLDRPDDGSELLAAVGMLIVNQALMRWVDGPAHLDLGEQIDAGFDGLVQLARSTGELTVDGPRHADL